MPLFPEDLVEKNVLVNSEKVFSLEVKHCSSCPFSHELIDKTGDYLGNKCNISSCKYLLKEEEDNFPKDCPLKKVIDICIRVKIKK